MGVVGRIVLYAAAEDRAVAAAKAAFDRIAALDAVMSDYRPDSELMRLCARAGQGAVTVSPELFEVLAQAQRLAELSDGAFDVTVGPYVRLWREARRARALPPPDRLAEARSRVGWRLLRLDPASRRVELLRAGMQLDLGGIAKGFAADEALAVLSGQGVARALVELGGDIAVSGPPPGARGWAVGLGQAVAGVETIELSHQAISTSGDAEQFVEIGGERYSHVVDPATGLGLRSRVAATVTAREAIVTDGLSTLLGVLGPERGQAFLATHQPGAKAWIRRAA